jgi:hypothetical protein
MPEFVAPATPTATWTSGRTRAVLAAGAVGLVLWAALGPRHTDAPGIRIRRAEALARASQGLRELGFQPDPRWTPVATIESDGISSLFVWRTQGKQRYHEQIDRYLVPPYWSVRDVSFHGDVVARAEEWQAWITGDGTAWRLRHVLPDRMPGATLDEPGARRVAEDELRRRLALDPAALVYVSAVSSRHPKRLDWTFTYADTAGPRLSQGQRRIAIEVSGDRVTDAVRYVFVPEEWERAERKTDTIMRMLGILRALAIAGVVVTAAAFGILAASRGALAWGFALRCFAIFAVLGLAHAALLWPRVQASLRTDQPLEIQMGVLLVLLPLVQLIGAALIALVAGWAVGVATPRAGGARSSVAAGIGAGAAAAGMLTLLGLFARGSGPLLGPFDAADTLAPWLDEMLAIAVQSLRSSAILLALFALLAMLTHEGTRRRVLWLVVLFVAGGLLVTPATAANPAAWAAQAALAGLGLLAAERWVFRFDVRLVPIVIAVTLVFRSLRGIILHAHPDAVAGGALAIVALVGVTMWWRRELMATEPPQEG